MNKIFITLMLLVSGTSVYAMGLDDIQAENMNKTAVSDYATGTTSTLMNIKYTGSSTQAAVAVDGTSFLTYTPIGTAGLTAAIATYSTLGKLCDYINAQLGYVCTLTGGKRDDTSNLLITTAVSSATDAKVNGGYSIGVASGTAGATSSYVVRLGITPATDTRVVLKYCTSTNAGTGTLLVYGKLRKFTSGSDHVVRDDTTQVVSLPSVAATPLTSGNIYSGNWIEFANNVHVVISAGNATTAQVAADSIQCFWDEK
jgi:hypothetical protein